MKKYSISIIILVLSLFGAYTANAQEESTTGRPIWVLGHAANSHGSLVRALADGANGVEIDVATCLGECEKDWSVAHDGYCTPEWRKEHNKVREPMEQYVSLEEYLKFPEIDKISLLWLDLKTTYYAPELIQYVHRILKERYRDAANVPFSIIYGFYKVPDLEEPRRYRPYTGEFRSVCKICADSLWVNEGINLAYEGTYHDIKNWSGTRPQIQKLLDDNGFPIEKHFMTNGLATGGFVWQTDWRWQHIIDSKKDMIDDKYCARVGFWCCTQGYHGVQAVLSKKDDPKGSMVRKNTECDVVLMECRTEFVPSRLIPFWSQDALREFVEGFFFKHGGWYGWNNGHYRRAKQSDKFYVKFSDPERAKDENREKEKEGSI